MNANELSYLDPEDYFRDYNDENLTEVLEGIIGKYKKEALSQEELLKQELKNSGIETMDIYKFILISKCHGFNEVVNGERINSIVDLNRLTSNIYTQTKLNRADVMRLCAALFTALGIIEKSGIKHVVEKAIDNLGAKQYANDELIGNAFTLSSSEYRSKTLDHFEKVFENDYPDLSLITEEDLRRLEALLISGIPKAKYYTACYILHSSTEGASAQEAINLLEQAFEEGDAQAAAKLADHYCDEGRDFNDREKAYRLYTGIGALALNDRRKYRLVGLFNQKMYYKQLLNYSVVLCAVTVLSMIFPLSMNIYPNFTILGILLSIVSLGVLVLGFVINKIRPYFNIQFIPVSLFIVWFFDILIRLLG